MGQVRTGPPPRQRGPVVRTGVRLSLPMRAWLEQPHGRRHKAPPQLCALSTKKSLFKVLTRRTGLVFAKQIRQNARKAARILVRILSVLSGFCFPPGKIIPSPPPPGVNQNPNSSQMALKQGSYCSAALLPGQVNMFPPFFQTPDNGPCFTFFYTPTRHPPLLRAQHGAERTLRDSTTARANGVDLRSPLPVVAKRQHWWAAFSTSVDRFLKESRTFRG